MKFGLILLSALWFMPMAARAQVDQLVTTQHQVQLSGGATLKYTAYAGRIPIRVGGAEEVHGYMFFVAYRVLSGTPRPVTFLWNGGPGSNSSTLHLESVGPKRVDENGNLLDVPETALATTDLVFVDAIGTGFSRMTKPEYAKEFYNTRADVAAFSEFVRAWRWLFDVPTAPLYIGGESWGSYRAAAVARDLQKHGIPIGGFISISGRTGFAPAAEPDPIFVALRLVHLPAIALYHGKLSPTLGKDTKAIEAQVDGWVREIYAPALKRVSSLGGDEREAIARKLSLYSGLPLGDIDRSTLMITPRQYLQGLLRDQGKVLTTNDMAAINGKPNPKRAETINAYLRHDLGFRTDLIYVGNSGEEGYAPNGTPLRGVGAQWDFIIGDYAHPKSPDATKADNDAIIARGEPPGGQDKPVTEDFMVDLNAKVMVVNGSYDSLIYCSTNAEVVNRLEPALRNRVVSRCYKGGHQFYNIPETRRQFSADLQAFVKQGGSR